MRSFRSKPVGWQRDNYRHYLAAKYGSIRGYKRNSEFREKMSQSMKERWNDPEYREKMSQIMKEQWNDPEHREKVSQSMSQGMKERWNDPEFREEMSRSMNDQLEVRRSMGVSDDVLEEMRKKVMNELDENDEDNR
jgi:hypothetical protein